MTCGRCGKPTSGYHAAHRCSCPSEPQRRTMSRDERIATLTDEGVRRAMEKMTGVSDTQNRSEDRRMLTPDGDDYSRAARRARAAQRDAERYASLREDD